VGPVSPTAQGGTIATQTIAWDVNFTVNTAGAVLQSVDIYPIASGQSGVLKVLSGTGTSGTTLATINYTTNVSGGATPQTIPINYTFATTGAYSLYTSSLPSSGISRNNSGQTYPVTSSVANITGNGFDNTYWMGLYKWQFSTECQTNRQSINITVTTPPALAVDQSNISICSGVGTTVNVTPATRSNYTIFQWSGTSADRQPGGSPNGTSVVFKGINNTNTATTQLFTLTATGGGPAGLCANQALVAVTINPRPAAPTTTGVSICQNGASASVSAISSPASTLIGGSVPITFTNSTGDETTSFSTAKVVGSFTLPPLPAGATYHSARIIANGMIINGASWGQEVRLGIKTTGGANVTSTGYQGSTSASTASPFDYATLRTNADSVTIGTALPAAGGTFNVVYYESIQDESTAQDANFPSTGTLTFLYSLPTTYSWYTQPYSNTPIATGANFNPVGVAGSGLTNTATAGNWTYYASASNSICTSPQPWTPVVFSIGLKPAPTFTTAPGSTICTGTSVTYTTQAGKSNYVWAVPGVANTDYMVTGGGLGASSNTVTLQWLTAGTKTVTVNYNNGTCSGSSPASHTTTVGSFGSPTVAVAVTGGSNPTCYGGKVTFTATPTNAGSNPTYVWKKDGGTVGTNSATYTDPGTTAGSITVTVTSNVSCAAGAQVTSTPVTLTVNPNAWTGAISTDFSNPANWCAGTVPTAAANISIPSGVANMPKLSSFVMMNNLDLATGATIDINGYKLTVNGTLSGAGLIKGSPSSTLILNGTGSLGTLNMEPSANALKVLELTGTGSLTLGNALDIYDSVDVNAATLTSNGLLTLKSLQSGTARVGEITTGSIVGDVTVERWLRTVSRPTWRLLSVPTKGTQTIKQAWQENQAPLANGNPGYGTILTSTFGVSQGYDATTTFNSLLKWNTSTNAFEYAGPTSNAIETTTGYFVFVRGDRSVLPTGGSTTTTTLRSKGNLYQGTQSVLNLPANQNTVVGNIYASSIDFVELQKSNITSFKVWDPILTGSGNITGRPDTLSGAFQTFSAANGWAPIPGGGSYRNFTTNTVIESGQAFVVSPAGSPGSITFTEQAKTPVRSYNLMRGNGAIKRIRTSLYEVKNNLSDLVDANVVVFDNSYSGGLDSYDVIKMNNTGENLAISNSGQLLVVDARPEIQSSDVINFAISNIKAQQYSLAFETENLDPALSAYLEDNYLHTQTPVALNTTQTVTFKVTSDAGSYAANRFRLVFRSSSTLPITFTKVGANERNEKVLVDWAVSSEKDIRSYDVETSADGRKFTKAGSVTARGNTGLTAAYNWLHEMPVTGDNFYRIRSVSGSGETKYSSIVKAVIGGFTSAFTVAPNPVSDGNVNLQFVKQAEGRYMVRIINGGGQVIYNQAISHAGGNSSNRIQLPPTISGGLYKIEIIKPNNERYIHNLVVSNSR